MKYHQPFGAADPDASFVNGDPSTGQEGSIPPAEQMELPQREIVNAIKASGQTPADGDLTQLAQAMGIGIYVGTFGGTANGLTATLPGNVALPALREGLTIHGYVGASPNTGAATLTVSGFATPPGAKPIKLKNGTSDPAAGDLSAGVLVSFRYDGAAWRSSGSLTSEQSGGATTNFASDTGTANAILVALSPAPTSYTVGMLVRTKIAADNTGPTTINVNGLGLRPVTHTDLSALVKNDVRGGEMVQMQFDGTQFQLQNPATLSAKNRSFFATKASSQALTNSIYTDVNWTATAPAWGTWDGTSLTFSQAGEYLVTGMLIFTTITTASGYINNVANVLLNGVTIGGGAEQMYPPGAANAVQGATFCEVLTVSVADVLKIQGYDGSTVYSSGGITGSPSNVLSVTRLGG